MRSEGEELIETVTLSEAGALIESVAHRQSFLLLSPPGIGKSDLVRETAARAGLECRSLLGTQLAPEDVSGVPQIVGDRSVFCPPRILLPESNKPFCLFLDELPACAPDVQKSFYSLLLERRVGEHHLPVGTWVVAAGNRSQDRALVRSLSSALINRVTILQIKVDANEWLEWADSKRLRQEVISYIRGKSHALMREVPLLPAPFSTPRSWTALARAIERAEQNDALTDETLRALVAGSVSQEDVSAFCNWFHASQHVEGHDLRMGWSDLCDLPITSLSLSQQATNALAFHDINTVGQLIDHTTDELKNLSSFDEARVCEVIEALRFRGLRLKEKSKAGDMPSLTLRQAQSLVVAMADEQSLLMLSAPGVGKSEAIRQIAHQSHLECRSLLGTQIAPEDVSGIPRIEGERSVFCPPRALLPEGTKPFCLFLDELPASPADIQKAFYSLLLERRVGEHALPKGTWVVAAGNRQEDRALVRSLSSALLNRVFVLHIRVDRKEWLAWAINHGVRSEILAFITYMPEALMRAIPKDPVPFSTPRSWVSLSHSLTLVEQRGGLNEATRRALAFGTLSAQDAALFCAMSEESLADFQPIEEYFIEPEKLPTSDTARWFIINRLRKLLKNNELPPIEGYHVNHFLVSIPSEFRFAVMIDLVDQWAQIGASDAMLESLREVTGLPIDTRQNCSRPEHAVEV